MFEELEKWQTPEARCEPGDIFIQEDHQGWWVYSWDGNSAWTIGDKPLTLDEARQVAAECRHFLSANTDKPWTL